MPGGALLVAAFVAAAGRSSVNACVEIDHVSDLATIEAALGAGVGAVMADGSGLAFDENVAFTRAAVEAAARHVAHVEGELGGSAGGEDGAGAVEAGGLMGPGEGAAFIDGARGGDR